jgi:hypothetical protein
MGEGAISLYVFPTPALNGDKQFHFGFAEFKANLVSIILWTVTHKLSVTN